MSNTDTLAEIALWQGRPHHLIRFVGESEGFRRFGSFEEERGVSKMIYRLSTGGWSDNEDMIQALQGNHLFWTLYWETSRRGGHHTFEIPHKI